MSIIKETLNEMTFGLETFKTKKICYNTNLEKAIPDPKTLQNRFVFKSY